MLKKTLAILLFLNFLFGFSRNTVSANPAIAANGLQEAVVTESKDGPQDKPNVANENFYPKSLEQNFREKYKGPEFDYYTVQPMESLWERLQKRLVQLIESIFGKMNPDSSSQYAGIFMRFIAILITGFVLYLVIRYLVQKNGNLLFGRKNKNFDIGSGDLHENIHEINFDERIADFELQKDYRSAIRYRFLSVLKKLNDQKILEWNPEKTNKDYISELKNPLMKERFRELVYIFDYVWYGGFFIDESAFQIFKKKFIDFNS